MGLKSWNKNVLSVLTIVVGSFILFNIAFLLTALVVKASMSILVMTHNAAAPVLSKVISLIVILLISWVIFKSRLNTLVKATFLTIPLMVVLVMVVIALYGQSKLLTAVVGFAIISAVLLFLKKKKLSWQYYFATFYVAIFGLCILFFNIQI